jgi:hypothetical protein
MSGILRETIYPVGFDFIDPHCKLLVEYLTTELNELLFNAVGTNVVKTPIPFNNIFIPLSDFPALKVYKTDEVAIDPLSNIFMTSFQISYILAYNTTQKTSDLGAIVGKEISRLLHVFSFREGLQLDTTSPVTIDYDELIDSSEAVYSYVNVSCKFLTSTC